MSEPESLDAGSISVTVIGGYLGAGKTTLVNHILRSAQERIAVLVNDFGDINIDADLIESEDGDTISLANGCICCSLVDGFASALATVREFEPPPTRLVIEASGVADPATVAAYGHGPGLSLDAVVVVVDAETIRAKASDRYVGDTVRAQLGSADIVVLNKLDLIGDDGSLAGTVPDPVSEATPVAADAVASLRSWVATLAPDALIVATSESVVDPEILFGRFPARSRTMPPTDHADHADGELGEDGERGHHRVGHGHEPAESLYESWTWTGDVPLGRDTIADLMAALPDEVVRAKGLMAVDDRPDRAMVLQRVGRRWTLRAGPDRSDDRSRLVVIGYRDALTADWLGDRLG